MRVFARKILDLKKIGRHDIANEERAIKKLCSGTNENIICVLGLGEFKHGGESYIYIDMERCDLSLTDYMKSIWAIAKTWHDLESEVFFATRSIWNIMRQITVGLRFVHSHNEVHRDLKPQNGIYTQI